jgi:hypothetical protein
VVISRRIAKGPIFNAILFCPLPSALCPLPTAHCPLPTAYRLLPTAYRLLPTTYCLPPTAYHLLLPHLPPKHLNRKS